MNSLEWCRPCEGLRGSGYALAMVWANTLITSYVTDTNMISVSVPGQPCDPLLALSEAGAEELIEHLRRRLSELRERTKRHWSEQLRGQ
ncbi:hypothetical protein [Saccharopolyspora rosea]|uniref:hypothetical protein n=1 Tax=Saccharopolyspora rosea TaxID=524884 RepID=UPI0021D8306B|nr:hypothetical protein [Saccharopolyspora rosea]